MTQPLPGQGALAIGAGQAMGSGVVDFLSSLPDQRIWHILRETRDLTTADTGGAIAYFATATTTALAGNVERASWQPGSELGEDPC